MLTRRPDWQTRLANYLAAQQRTPFRYGVLDCCLFACGGVQAMTDVDLAVNFRGTYTTRKTAMDAIRAYCGRGSVEALAVAMAAEHGIEEIAANYASRGDVVSLGVGMRATLGLIAMHGTEIIAPHTRGLVRVPRHLAVRAWRIG